MMSQDLGCSLSHWVCRRVWLVYENISSHGHWHLASLPRIANHERRECAISLYHDRDDAQRYEYTNLTTRICN